MLPNSNSVNHATLDRRTQGGHQVLEVLQIVPGEQHRAQDFARSDQVMEVGARERAAGVARTTGVERRRVVGKAGVPEVERA